MIRYFYCPTCGKIHVGKIDGEIYTKDNNLQFNIYCWYHCECGNDAVEIDHGLLLIIQNINKTRFKTQYCCEGHIHVGYNEEKKYSNAYILFSQLVTTTMFNNIISKYPLPQGWSIEIDNNKNLSPEMQNCICIRYTELDDIIDDISENEFEIKKTNYLMELTRWVNHIMIEESDLVE